MLIDFILVTLSVTGFISNRRERRVCYHFTTFIFCLIRIKFLRIMFVKKSFNLAVPKTKLILFITTTSLFYFMSERNNAHSFLITGIENFSRNKSSYKASTRSQNLDFTILFHQNVKLNFCKLFDNCHVPGFLGYYIHGWIIWLCSSRGESTENLVGGSQMGDVVSRWGESKLQYAMLYFTLTLK